MRARTFGLLLLVVVGMAPLALAGIFIVRRAERTALDGVREGNQRVADRAARRLHAYVVSELERLRTLSTFVAPAVGTSANQVERVAKNFLIGFPHLKSLDIVANHDCREIATGRLDGVVKTRCGEMVVDTALRGEVYLGPVALSENFAPVMTIGVPLTIAGEAIGAAVADVDLIGLWPAVNEVRVGDKGYARLVGSDDVLIAHGDPEERRRVFLREKDPFIGAIRAAGTTGARYQDSQGRDVVATSASIKELGWTVIVEQPVAEAFRAARLMRSDLFGIVVVAVALALLAGVLFGRRPLQALESMRLHARQIGQGNLDARVPIPRLQELRLLAETMNDMAARLAVLQEELKARERIATFGRVAAGLAHDLKQPITDVRVACDAFLKAPDKPSSMALLRAAADEHLPRLNRYVNDLRRLAQDGKVPMQFVTLQPRSLADQVVAEASHSPKWEGVVFEATGSASPVLADKDLIIRAMANLVGNAADACLAKAGGHVTLAVADDPDGHVVISVTDTGKGMPVDRLSEILANDFRSDKRGSGVGLGLGVVRHVAAAHGGSVDAESHEGLGSTFRIVLPRQPSERPPDGQEAQRRAS